MGTGTLIQIVFDIFMACGLFVIVMRMNRAPKDDPRLSRGLQLLQSKIAVLEDLSDRTEAQVSQLTAILESKSREVQAKVQLAEQHVHEIRISMERSLEVAKIFQDKIPHREIIERQNTIKYVQAARMAHQGASVDDIAKAVDLPRGEIEFIASVNRERLMFDESELPEWVATGNAPSGASFMDIASEMTVAQAAAAGADFGGEQAAPAETQEEQTSRLRSEIELAENQRLVENLSRLQNEMQNLDQQLSRENANRDFAGAFEVPKVETESLKKLGEEFRKAVREGEAADARQPFPPLEQLSTLIPSFIEAIDSHTDTAGAGAGAGAGAQAFGAGAVASTASSAGASAAGARSLGDVLGAPISAPSAPANVAGLAIETPVAASSANGFGSGSGASSRDPVLSRAVAESKVQAALRSTARPVTSTRAESPELEAARALAREVAPKTAAKSTVQSAQAPKAAKGEVRKVVFPRIDGSDV